MVKKSLINIGIVILIVFILDFTIGRGLRHFYFTQSSGFNYRTAYAMEMTEAEILVLGSSRANHNYIPEIFEDSLNMSFYNAGRDGAGVLYQTALLKSVLKRYTPELIIIDYYGSFEKGIPDLDNKSTLLPFYRTHDEIREFVTANNKYEKIKLLSEIYPFNSEVLSIAIGNLEINKSRQPDNKGYVPLYREWQSDLDSADTESIYEPDPYKIDACSELLNIAANSNSKVVAIYSPIFRENANRQEIEICRNLCSAENVPFWDFSDDTLFLNDRKLFQDVQHLNHNGAYIFSLLIVNRIKDII